MISDKLSRDQIDGVSRLIEPAERVVILTHMSPDGDAMGSSLAVYWWLKETKQAQVIVPNVFPEFYDWMPGAQDVLICEKEADRAQQLIDQADLIICTDFNEPKRIGQLGQMAINATCPKILIDHHLFPSDFADVTISSTNLSNHQSPITKHQLPITNGNLYLYRFNDGYG